MCVCATLHRLIKLPGCKSCSLILFTSLLTRSLHLPNMLALLTRLLPYSLHLLRQRSLVDVVVVAATVNFMRAHTLKKNAVRRAKRKWGGVRQPGAGNEAQAA